MNIQRYLKILAFGLLTVTVFCVMVLPDAAISLTVKENLAKWSVMVFLILFVVSLDRKGQRGRFLGALQYGALFLLFFGALGSYYMTTTAEIDVPVHRTVSLKEANLDDYTLKIESVRGKQLDDARMDVVYTRPDRVSFHTTISQKHPLNIDSVEIHPLEMQGHKVVFSVHKDGWRYVILLGAVIFVVSILFSLLSSLLRRKRGGYKC